MATVNGTDINLYINKPPAGFIPVAFATKCELEFEAENIDQTNKDSQGWLELMLGIRSFTIKIDSLYQNIYDTRSFYSMLEFRQPVTFQIRFAQFAQGSPVIGPVFQGGAFVVSLNYKGENETGAEFNCMLNGIGKMNILNV